MARDRFEEAAANMLGGVGSAEVQAFYPGVGAAQVQAYYPGVGAPAAQVPQLQERAVQYSPTQYRSGEVSYLGFGRTTIPAGAEITVQINTKRPFTPQQLRIPSTVQDLLIMQALLEGTNLFANQAGIPVELFSEVSTTPPIDWFTIDTSTGAELVIQNPTGVDKTFSGAFWGTALRK